MIIYSYAPVVQEILVKRLKEYFESVGWIDQYPNFPIKITNQYPFEDFITDGVVDLSDGSADNLFPCVTIDSASDTSALEELIDSETTTLLKAEFEEFKNQAKEDESMISDEALLEMKNHFKTHDELHGILIKYESRDNITIDITTDDYSNVKNRIFDYVRLYATGQGAIDLHADFGITIFRETLTGDRSGAFNVDYGRTLRKATISFNADYSIYQVYYDTEAERLEEVEVVHNTEVPGGGSEE